MRIQRLTLALSFVPPAGSALPRELHEPVEQLRAEVISVMGK